MSRSKHVRREPTWSARPILLATLKDRATTLGQLAETAVDTVHRTLADVRALDDPLEIQADLERELHQTLGAIEREQARVRDELLHAQARQARASRATSLDPAHVADLSAWLNDIAQTLESGAYTAARIGLQRWTAVADPIYSAEEQRQEQLALVKALRAMAQRRREKGLHVDPRPRLHRAGGRDGPAAATGGTPSRETIG